MAQTATIRTTVPTHVNASRVVRLLAMSIASTSGCAVDCLDDIAIAVSEAVAVVTAGTSTGSIDGELGLRDDVMEVFIAPGEDGGDVDRPAASSEPPDPFSLRILETVAVSSEVDEQARTVRLWLALS